MQNADFVLKKMDRAGELFQKKLTFGPTVPDVSPFWTNNPAYRVILELQSEPESVQNRC